jgi:hypothetical protein
MSKAEASTWLFLAAYAVLLVAAALLGYFGLGRRQKP